MRPLTSYHALTAAAAIAMLTGCSGGGSSSVAPAPISPAGARHLVSYYSCPATGSLKYVSDFFFNVVNVYAGGFANQAPCGQIAASSFFGPQGLFVQASTHDLYVANTDGRDILVFHRGQTTPYNTYTDPSVQYPIDVTVARDGTVLASNNISFASNGGSVSTWIGGPNGGTYVGNFPMVNSYQGETIAVKKNGTVYFDDVDKTMLQGFVWSMSCPAGACGAQTRVAGVVLKFPGGIVFDSTGDLIVADMFAVTADTFELPNPNPSTMTLAGNPFAVALSTSDHHLFVTDSFRNEAEEYSYPGGALIGVVHGVLQSNLDGIAVDP